jgi:transketolase
LNPFNYSVEKLQAKALDVRRDIITMLVEAKSGHTGGPLSCTDFATALFFRALNHKPSEPNWSDRDFVFYSIGHVTPVNYSVLAECGYFPLKDLMTFRKLNSRLQGHPHRLDTPGIEVSSGSLGQGLSIACGVAKASKIDGHARRVYCIMGDGELQEGSCWESAMFAGHYKLDNLGVIVDYNKRQIDGEVPKIMDVAPLAEKWRAFNWHVIGIDGHSLPQIIAGFEEMQRTSGKPTVIIANTTMGKGVSFMEGKSEWHGKPPSREQGEQALQELGTNYADWSSRLLAG